MRELALEVEQYGSHESLVENIKHSLSLGLPEFAPGLCTHDGTFVVVGSGPSVADHLDEIRQESLTRPICAVKGAYDYLRDNGISPAIYLTVEPRLRPVKNPHKDSTYLIASRCSPETFEALKDYNVVIWNSWSKEYENEAFTPRMGVGGGTTSGLRAISIGWLLGFRNFHLYGFDSCLTGGEKRIGQGAIHPAVSTTDVIVGNRSFTCNMAMAQQADDFQGIYEFIPDIHIESFGDGLISAIIEQRKKEGMVT
ncbi:DUF115 domain-containing protein [Porticoccaceae bacterium]|nr:DUF115 domain-containing protein [Porticoccaceae bacterium]